MNGWRKRYPADFKAKVALEAIRGELTLAQLAANHGVHQALINTWQKHAIEGSGTFSGKSKAAEEDRQGEIDKLHAMIGQLAVERLFETNLRSLSIDRRRQMIEPKNPDLSIARQCKLVGVGRSGFYAPSAGESEVNSS